MRFKTIVGREAALIYQLTDDLQAMVGGPPAAKAKVARLKKHNSERTYHRSDAATFRVQIVGPDGKPTGHIARVTVTLDEFDQAVAQAAANGTT